MFEKFAQAIFERLQTHCVENGVDAAREEQHHDPDHVEVKVLISRS